MLSCWILTAQWHQKGLMYGVENRFKMLLLLGLKRPHCGMRFQQPSTTSLAKQANSPVERFRKFCGMVHKHKKEKDVIVEERAEDTF